MPRRKRQHPHQHLIRLLEAVNVPPPKMWPGAVDLSLARPDSVKFDYAQFASDRAPGKAKLDQFEAAYRDGPLGRFPDIHHWAMEEFWWHGIPGDDWHPLEAYLAWAGDRYPPSAQEQLRRWKEARIGLFEVGEIRKGTLGLQEWDATRGVRCGPPFRAIALNIGGVNAFRGLRGHVTVSYVAPWSPDENLFCAMGYSLTPKKSEARLLEVMLWLRRPEIVGRPFPWRVSREAADRYLREWRAREWHGWLRERLEFPFEAMMPSGANRQLEVKTVTGLAPMGAAMARQVGNYFEVPMDDEGKEIALVGVSEVMPLDLASPTWAAVAEYQGYRERVGRPPGTRGQPKSMTFDRFNRSR